MSNDSAAQIPYRYQIKVQGQLDPDWSDWFSGMVIEHQLGKDGSSMTILTGAIVDQAALRGILHKLWDLNLVLYSVQLLGANDAPHGGQPLDAVAGYPQQRALPHHRHDKLGKQSHNLGGEHQARL